MCIQSHEDVCEMKELTKTHNNFTYLIHVSKEFRTNLNSSLSKLSFTPTLILKTVSPQNHPKNHNVLESPASIG